MIRWRRSAEQVEADLAAALDQTPGVLEQHVVYTRLAGASASVSGTVVLDSAPTFEAVLRTLVRQLTDSLGTSAADRVAIYVTGRTDDSTPIDAATLGLSQKPSVAELRRL